MADSTLMEEVGHINRNKDMQPLQELPKVEVTEEEKLYEIYKAINAVRVDVNGNLQRIERKMDFIYELVKKRLGGM